MSAFTRLVFGLVLKRVIGEPRAPVPPAAAAPAARAEHRAPPRGALFALMLACLVVGMAVMLAFHSPLARIVGVSSLFTFIVSGVFLIADPAFLGADEDAQGRSR